MKKFHRFTAVFCAVAITFCCVFAYKTAASEPLPVVLEQNISAMTDIKDYGPDFVYDYICPNGTEDEIIAVLDNIKSISDQVTAGIDDDYEKMRALDSYVSNLVAYDHDAAHNDVSFDTICLENVLDRNRTTCAGFSNLYAALAQAQGLYCVNIRGSAPDAELGITRANLGDESTPINHEWTAVWYEAQQRWVHVDCTWNSLSTYENGEFSMKKAVTAYFDKPIEELSVNHKADSVVYRDFFGVNAEYFSGKIDFAQKPEVTPDITTTTASSAETSAVTTVSQTKAQNSEDKETTTQTTTTVPGASSESEQSDDDDSSMLIIIAVLGGVFAVGAVAFMCIYSKNSKADKGDKNRT